MSKKEKYVVVGLIIFFPILWIVIIFGGCEDARSENKVKWEWVRAKESNRMFQCVACRAEFSEHRHLEEHRCSFISKEDAWKLERLADDIKKYGINYPTEPNEIWGNGDPDPNHVKYFGNSNLSRLCFVQTQLINNQAKLINELVALNAKQHQILGKSDIELFNRVRKLEDPND